MNDETIDFIKKHSEKILNIDFIRENIDYLAKQSSNNNIDFFKQDLSNGIIGLILLSEELNKQNIIHNKQNTDDLISILLDSIQKKPIMDASLFEGVSGIAFSLALLNRPDLCGVINQLNDFLFTLIDVKISEQKNRIHSPAYSYDFDTMYGLSGVLNYLVYFFNNSNDENEKDIVGKRIIRIEKHIVDMYSTQLIYDDISVPAWFVSSDHQMDKRESINYPKGNFNISFSHGISGLLYSLSNAYLSGLYVSNQLTLMNKMHTFIYDNLLVKNDVFCPPFFIDFNSFTKEKKDSVERFDSWCYGTPGIDIALLKYNLIKRNPDEVDLMSRGLQEINKKPLGIADPSMCHGYAGILAILNSLNKDYSLDIHLNKKIVKLLLSYFDNESITGFFSERFDDAETSRNIPDLGMLSGTSGIFLSLLSLKDKQYVHWGKIFGL
ncbi:Nisin biosynthesis protein NisC (plasmid) [Apilactobacillus kunkeei]|uniref:Lantibiotic cyclase KukC n=1 Tax=Apilactobacillus kunkeei TaxID=148814 RepID=A0A1L8CIE2_9LACO|nr:lanthionine synthetase C family protein [Apilactobacillus kunkeei]CAI2670845.1 Nisin biosynthesis protein NisC [Apilactobacillus kunkeei]CAI2671425.1 Nisin biosynthesis protein NisC [Apilactobacillus kunkeei]CAI2674868.1 Nisin biosynthesis protein NisC [Apilactobacillus kunkeei]CAI2675778.1 Nisin biosynthesis protein NisC [Apilactobacillus kunkeei]CAI2675920.1 Nisin biosynthesis protein NisC [Apilactobacillus kunkeei]